ncbi:hypothetical protein L0244_34035 [bacterium]|nr:hypothetical protein [bacterium]
MKKMIAFLMSTVIPVIIPMCVIVSLPVCVAEKYLPQDMKNSVQYGMRFFHLVWAANGDSKEQQPLAEQELTPYVESTVTSMTLASLEPEPDCEFVQRPQSKNPALLEVDSFPGLEDQLEAKIDVIVDKTLDDGRVSRAELQKLHDLKVNFNQEILQSAIQRAIRHAEVVNQINHMQKRNQKAIRVVVKTKPISPA